MKRLCPSGEEPGAWISLRGLCLLASAGFFAQLILGAIMRHIGAGLAIPDFPRAFGVWIPPVFTFPIAIHYAHRVGAGVMTLLSLSLVFRVFRRQIAHRPLVALAGFLLLCVACQLTLGASIIWLRRPVPITTAHLVVGAPPALATTVALTVQVFRLQKAKFYSEALFQLPLRAPLEAK